MRCFCFENLATMHEARLEALRNSLLCPISCSIISFFQKYYRTYCKLTVINRRGGRAPCFIHLWIATFLECNTTKCPSGLLIWNYSEFEAVSWISKSNHLARTCNFQIDIVLLKNSPKFYSCSPRMQENNSKLKPWLV